jgi:hypothetical protein
MIEILKCYFSILRHSFGAQFLLKRLPLLKTLEGFLHSEIQPFHCIVIWSLVIWTLYEAKLQAATDPSTASQVDISWTLASQLSEPVTRNTYLENLDQEKFTKNSQHHKLLLRSSQTQKLELPITRVQLADKLLGQSSLSNRLEPAPFLLAAPENFNPGLWIPPLPSPPPPPKSSRSPLTKPVKPLAILESLQTDFRYETDNFGLENLFIEPKAQFRLPNGNKITFKTGLNHFAQHGVESVTNIPIQIGWVEKVGHVTLQAAAGLDFLDHLPTAINLNARVEAPIVPAKVSKAGKLLSVVTLSANLEQGPFKSNARSLNNQITAWRFGPDLYWQMDRDTSVFSSLRLGNYNDGNSEVLSFSRLEHKLGQFSLAANLFTWSYQHDLEHKSGYFSPADFLVYNAELGWQGDISTFLRCRLSANLGQQRLKGKFDNANSYQTRCTVKLSPNVEADIDYSFSNVRSHQTGGNSYGGNSLVGQLRIKF